MNFNPHSNLEGRHAFLSPSKYYWINYTLEDLRTSYVNFKAIQRGTDLHALAAECIRLGVKLVNNKSTFNAYVNDAIKYHMTPEQGLYFSENCFGTCDAISFDNNLLRIHDLKTGVTKASMHQLEIYDALFCLEYRIDPKDINIENRIYQLDEINVGSPPFDYIYSIMDKIVEFDNELTKIKLMQ